MRQVLRLESLDVRYGAGCVYCRPDNAVLEKNRCPKCRTIWALRDVSLEVYPNEILGVVGESGSGKSTLLQALYFSRPADRGRAYMRDYKNGDADVFSVSSQSQQAIRNNLLGMVYQNPTAGLLMDFSSGGNVAQKLIAAGRRSVSGMRGRTRELLTHMEVPLSRVKEPPKNFSGGMQQRVQISKAIANNPPILLLDEVTTGLDLPVQARVLDLIRSLKKTMDIAMIVVSHDLGVIRMLADRTMVMLDGRVAEHGLTDQILQDPQNAYTQTLVHSLL